MSNRFLWLALDEKFPSHPLMTTSQYDNHYFQHRNSWPNYSPKKNLRSILIFYFNTTKNPPKKIKKTDQKNNKKRK